LVPRLSLVVWVLGLWLVGVLRLWLVGDVRIRMPSPVLELVSQTALDLLFSSGRTTFPLILSNTSSALTLILTRTLTLILARTLPWSASRTNRRTRFLRSDSTVTPPSDSAPLHRISGSRRGSWASPLGDWVSRRGGRSGPLSALSTGSAFGRGVGRVGSRRRAHFGVLDRVWDWKSSISLGSTVTTADYSFWLSNFSYDYWNRRNVKSPF